MQAERIRGLAGLPSATYHKEEHSFLCFSFLSVSFFSSLCGTTRKISGYKTMNPTQTLRFDFAPVEMAPGTRTVPVTQ